MLTKTTILDYQPLQQDMVLIYFVRKPVLTTGLMASQVLMAVNSHRLSGCAQRVKLSLRHGRPISVNVGKGATIVQDTGHKLRL